MRAVHDLLHDYQHVIAELTLVMGSKGVFDVEVDGSLLYSKKATGRHAKEGEVLDLFRAEYAKDIPVYEH